MIITSMYTNEVLQNINNTSKLEFSFSILPFKEFWERRTNQTDRSHYIILLLSQMANSVQKIKITLFKILSLKEPSNLIGHDDFWLFGKNDFWLYLKNKFSKELSPHKSLIFLNKMYQYKKISGWRNNIGNTSPDLSCSAATGVISSAVNFLARSSNAFCSSFNAV